ncbi:MAG: hypothetical protein IT436_02230 [Phycisphaerales bacterium]|nr:hypothetical protein [Phycisphaerales bacterium]
MRGSTPPRWSGPGVAIKACALAITLALADPALAQRLNLQSSGAPAAGSGAATLALADSLNKQIDGLRKQSGADPSVRVSIALRTTARDLLLAGEAAGETGSAKVLLGRTIADQLAALDGRAGDAAKLDRPAQEAVTRDLDVQKLPPDEVRIERWLRDALAPITQTAGGPPPPGPAGWFEAGEKPAENPEPLVRWAAGLEITDPLRAAITKLDERLRSAENWVAYRPAARRTALLVRRAAGPLEDRLGWMTAEARHELENRLVEALAPLNGDQPAGENEQRDPALMLRRIAGMSRLLERAAMLDDSTPAVRDLRASLMAGLKVAGPSSTEDRRLATLDRALALAQRRKELEKDTSIVRQLKPGLRALAPAARESEAAMLSAARRLLTDEGAVSDPAVLNAVSAHQRRVDDLALIVDVNRLISTTGVLVPGEKPMVGVAAEYKGLADWMFEIGQDLAKPARRDLALAELRDVAGGAIGALESGPLTRLRGLVDPSLPRQPGPAIAMWNDLTGDRAAALVDAAAKARAGLITAWTARDVPRRQEADRRARQINRVLEAIDDAAWSRSLAQVQQSGLATPNTANLQQWPGWQLSPAALQAVSDGLTAACRAAVDRLIAGDAGGTESAVRGLETRFAVALLAGRLERLATEAGLGSARPGAGSALLEIGLGPPDPERSWMVGERPALAAVCRYAEEWAAAAPDPKQGDRARSLKVYIDGLAARTLERVRAGG